MKNEEKPLSMRQERFVEELIKGKSQQDAYRTAYAVPAGKRVSSSASRLLANPRVAARYRQLHDRVIEEAEAEAILTAKDVLRELRNIAFADIGDYIEVGEGQVFIKPTAQIPVDRLFAVASIKQTAGGVELKLYDKLKALEMLGRHFSIFSEKPLPPEARRVELAEELEKWAR